MANNAKIVLRRSKGDNKEPLKEKIVAIYEDVFQGKDPSVNQSRFWDELFLLTVNIPFLERCITMTIEDQLLSLQPILNKLFHFSLLSLQDPNPIRRARSIETYSVLFKGLFRKTFKNFALDTITIICGINEADKYFNEFLLAAKGILEDSKENYNTKQGMITLLEILVTATDNINQNSFLEHFMQVDLLPGLLKTLITPEIARENRFQAMLVLSILSYYQKFEGSNPYFISLSKVDIEEVIQGHIKTCTSELTSLKSSGVVPDTSTVFERVTSIFTFWMPTPEPTTTPMIPSMGGLLLSVYDWVHTNAMYRKALCSSNESPTSFGSDPKQVTELLQNLFQFASGIFPDVHGLYQACYTKMCMTIFLCLTEDPDSAELLHSPEVGSFIPSLIEKTKISKRPAVNVILDLVVNFLKTNLRKKLQFGLYLRALNIIQRVICFEKRNSKPQINYKWKHVWDALFLVVKFIATPEMFENKEVLQIGTEITTIFNLFITYGDSFLEATSDYDELFYEMIHQSKILMKFHNVAESTRSCAALVNLQENITTIVQHFSCKLDHWQKEHPNTTLLQPMVIEIIKSNYSTLKLNLFDGLDQYVRYVENPKEIPFFKQYLRMIVFDAKPRICINPIHIDVL